MTDAEKITAVEDALDGGKLIAEVRSIAACFGLGLRIECDEWDTVGRAANLLGQDLINKIWDEAKRKAEDADYARYVADEEMEAMRGER